MLDKIPFFAHKFQLKMVAYFRYINTLNKEIKKIQVFKAERIF